MPFVENAEDEEKELANEKKQQEAELDDYKKAFAKQSKNKDGDVDDDNAEL